DLTRRMAAADRTDLRHLVRLRPLGPALQNHAYQLRYDVAGALHHDGVTDPHILARDLVLIVHRDVLHHDAADRHWLDMGDGSERAGAPDIDGDALDLALCLLGGEFVGDRPARAARHETKPVLQIQAVHLVDDAVDIVAELGAG